jgi:hypothetical protein
LEEIARVQSIDVTRTLRREDFQFEQRRVVIGASLALLVSAVILIGGYLMVSLPLHGTAAVAERLAFALKVDIMVLLWPILAIISVGNGRFMSRDDIQGAGFYPPSERIAIPVAILQNTIEQTVLAVGAHLILATMLVGQELVILPLLALLFCAGRVAFWAGYRDGAGRRAFGFALTFFPTVAAYGLTILLLIRRG